MSLALGPHHLPWSQPSLEGRTLADQRVATAAHVVANHTGSLPGLLANVAQLDRKAGQLRVGSGRAGPAVDAPQPTRPSRRPPRERPPHRTTGSTCSPLHPHQRFGLWQRIQPLLPPPPSHARGGAPRSVPDRACMAAIVFMGRTSTPWALLPVGEFGCGSVTSCWRRFAEWARLSGWIFRLPWQDRPPGAGRGVM